MRPPTTRAEFVADAVAVLDAAASSAAVRRGLSLGALLRAAARGAAPGARRRGACSSADDPVLVAAGSRARRVRRSTRSSTTDEGWAKYNRHYWLRDYRGFLEFFFGQIFPEPHSTKQIEDCVAFGLDTTPEMLVATQPC